MKIGTDSYLQQTQNYAAYSKQTKAAEETKSSDDNLYLIFDVSTITKYSPDLKL